MDLKDKKTQVKYYAGMSTIGGTYIEVKYETDRIIFDCGSIYDPNINEQNLNFHEILKFDLVPEIEGLFDRRITNQIDRYNTAVLVSHIHLDHTKMINFIDNEIPIYTSNDTKILLNALNINRDFIFNNKLNNSATRDIIGLEYDHSINIGNIEVKFVRVDHDGYGACGFIINTPDMKIAYTGDIRLHGYLKENSIDFIKQATNCDLLIIEGVSVSFKDFTDEIEEDEISSEQEFLDKFINIVETNPNKQITFDYYITNIERILKIIKYCERKIVLDEFNAFILKEVTGKSAYYYSLTNNRYNLDENYQVDFKNLINDENVYLWQFTSRDEMDISRLKDSSIYIHCDAQPLGDFDPMYERFVNSLLKNNIEFVPLKCSGHAHPNDLMKIINLIKAKILTPIHSFRPEMLYNNFGETILPQKNETL